MGTYSWLIWARHLHNRGRTISCLPGPRLVTETAQTAWTMELSDARHRHDEIISPVNNHTKNKKATKNHYTPHSQSFKPFNPCGASWQLRHLHSPVVLAVGVSAVVPGGLSYPLVLVLLLGGWALVGTVLVGVATLGLLVVLSLLPTGGAIAGTVLVAVAVFWLTAALGLLLAGGTFQGAVLVATIFPFTFLFASTSPHIRAAAVDCRQFVDQGLDERGL